MLKPFDLLCTKIGLYHRDDAQKIREVRARVLAKVGICSLFLLGRERREREIMN